MSPRLLLLLMVAALGCEDVTGPERGAEPIQTDALHYLASYVNGEGTYRQYGFTVVAVFRNTTDQTLYLGRCFPDSPGPLYGVTLADGSGGEVGYNPGWACVGHDRQFAIAPGEARTDTLQVEGPNSWDGHTGQAFGQLEGRFRLFYEAQTCPGDGACSLPYDYARSNAFDVSLRWW